MGSCRFEQEVPGPKDRDLPVPGDFQASGIRGSRIDRMDATNTDVHVLIRRIRQGEDSALGTLLEMYRHYLSLLARLQIREPLVGKLSPSDVVQETFLKAKRGFSEFRGETEAELMGWLRRILANRLAEASRHFGTRQRDVALERSIEAAVDQSSFAIHQWLVSNEPTPSEIASRREQAVQLADALSALPADYAEVLILRHLEDLSFPMIAERLNRSLNSVKNIWARAIVKLRFALETHR